MPSRKKKRRSCEKPVSAISQKSRSHSGGVFKGFGIFPNKPKTVRPRESGSRAVWSL